MLNKKIIVACILGFFLVATAIGTSLLSQKETSKVSLSKTENLETKSNTEVKDESIKTIQVKDNDEIPEVTANDETTSLKNSEEPAQLEKTESTEAKKPSLSTASRGGSLASRKVTESKQNAKASEVPKKEEKTEPAVASKPAPVSEPKPATATSNSINGWSQEDYYWLAKIIYAESRGEPYDGQVAVGAVILRRVKHPDFPNTVYGVIFDKWDGKYYQFSPVADGSINLEPNETAYRAARDAMNGADPSGGALYFYNPAKSTSQWILSRPILKTIGEHTFAL